MSKPVCVLACALLLFPACRRGGGPGGATVATPTFSPAGGTYSTAQDVTISCVTSGAVIHYTVDGSPPTAGSPTYSAAIHVAASETIKAYATASGETASAAGSAAYVIGSLAQAAAPTFSPPAGTYPSAQTVTIATTSTGASLYYTTDGSTPTPSSTLYSAPVNVAASETLKAIASGGGFTASTVASAAYVITLPAAAAPTFSPGAGTYSSAQMVTISSVTAGAQIHYTTDGSTPTTSSTLYSAPVQVSASETLTAIATATGYSPSAPAAASYVISGAAPAAPTIVSATSLTPTGAKVTWTAPASGPTPTSFTIYYATATPVTAANSLGTAPGGNAAATGAWVWGLAPTTQYYFAVSASAGSAEGPLSGSLGALTTAPMHATAISAAAETTVVLKADGSVWAWGAPWLGNNTANQSDVAIQVCATSATPGVCDTPFTGVASISAGQGFTLARKTDGAVWAWGEPNSGQLGNNPTLANLSSYAYLPAPVCGSGTAYSGSCGTSPQYLTGMSAIAAGWYHSVALSSDGTVWAWGDDGYGELGDGTTGDATNHIRTLPVHVLKGASSGDTTYLGDNAAAPVVAIGASAGHTVALKSDGTVWTWGSNDSGELGAGLPISLSTQVSTPVEVLKGASSADATYLGDTVKVVAISVGGSGTVLALKADGTLWSWGNNSNGQLGNNNGTVDSNVPVQVCASSTSPGVCDTALTAVTAFGAGVYDSYGATAAGTFAWGYNHYGTLGNGSTTDSGLPVRVPLIGSATSMASGFYHSVALQSDHTVWTWGGNNEKGQLGIGAHDPHASPLTYPPAMR